MTALPRLRPIDIIPYEVDGEQFFHLHDPEGISPDAALSRLAMFVVIHMDGRRGVVEIQSEFARLSKGEILPAEPIESLVRQLDESGFLANATFEKRRAGIAEQFAAAPVRPSAMAGRSYPADPVELEKQLDGYFTAAEGPGAVQAAAGKPLAGAIAPHIDFQRGGVCYAHAYKPIAEGARDAETFVILGVAHAGLRVPFAVLDKPFETPLGTAPVDVAAMQALRKRAPAWAFEEPLCHRTEHSAEFQVVFLQHVRRGRPFTIVPILCGSFELACGDKAPGEVAAVNEFVAALKESMGPKCFVLSGADLAHIGPRFGDPGPLTTAHIQQMEREDAASLEEIRRGDAEGFYRSVMADGNRRKVCGLGSVYTALRLLGRPGEVVRYGHAADPAGGEVSFVSAIFDA